MPGLTRVSFFVFGCLGFEDRLSTLNFRLVIVNVRNVLPGGITASAHFNLAAAHSLLSSFLQIGDASSQRFDDFAMTASGTRRPQLISFL